MAHLTRRSILGGIVGMAATPLFAAKLPLVPREAARDGVTLSIRDMTPRFLDFYAAAQGLDSDARYLMWKDRYGFAAVPPGPQGEAVSRKLLDAAWPRYADALPLIRGGAAGMSPAPLDTAVRVADLFRATRPLRIGIVAYVGGFEDNAFSMGTPDGPVVCLPVEMTPERRAIFMPHEMTRVVHMTLAHLPASYARPLSRVLFEEKLRCTPFRDSGRARRCETMWATSRGSKRPWQNDTTSWRRSDRSSMRATDRLCSDTRWDRVRPGREQR